jgi:hypothetical protein
MKGIKKMIEKNSTPRIEDKINATLVEQHKDNALDFVAFLRENGLTQDGECLFNYLEKDVCVIVIFGKKTWWVYWNTSDVNDDDNTNVCPELIKFAQSKRNKCKGGHCDQSPGTSRKIFGKEYQKLCTSTLAFGCPSGEALENIKKLVKCRMRDIKKQI